MDSSGSAGLGYAVNGAASTPFSVQSHPARTPSMLCDARRWRPRSAGACLYPLCAPAHRESGTGGNDERPARGRGFLLVQVQPKMSQGSEAMLATPGEPT